MDDNIRFVVKDDHVATPQEIELDRKLAVLKLADRIDRVCAGKCPDTTGRE